jgi:hypothetical protein
MEAAFDRLIAISLHCLCVEFVTIIHYRSCSVIICQFLWKSVLISFCFRSVWVFRLVWLWMWPVCAESIAPVCGKFGIVCSVIVEHVWNFSERACIKTECFTVKRVFADGKFTRAVRVLRCSLVYRLFTTCFGPYVVWIKIIIRKNSFIWLKYFIVKVNNLLYTQSVPCKSEREVDKQVFENLSWARYVYALAEKNWEPNMKYDNYNEIGRIKCN